MKYCVFRGCEGFGDRLQCLSQAIQYCVATNRILVIDWRDNHWTQEKYHSIYEYIQIKNIKTIDIRRFLSKHYNENLSIFNEEWRYKLSDKNTMKYMYNEKLNLPEKNKVLSKIIKKEKRDFEEDIVVYSGVFFRVWSKKFLKFINFSKKIYDMVEEVYNDLSVKKKEYICIHIRATSKDWNRDKNINKRLRERIKLKFPDKQKYFDYLYQQAKKIEVNLPILIVSDCIKTANEWVEIYKKGIIVGGAQIETLQKTGIHLVNLAEDGNISKHQLNLLCLRDFCIMANAKEIVSDGISLYSNMAKVFNDKS